MTLIRIAFVLFLTVLLLVTVAIAEFSARRLGLGDPLLYTTSVAVGYSLQPNQSKTRRRGAVVTIDSHGFRSVKDWSDPAKFRILFIGDSVTYGGSHIDDNKIFSAVVCRDLEENGVSDVTCGNAGTNAYGTDNMRARIRYSPVDNEDLIVVTIISSDMTRAMASLGGLPLYSKSPPPPVPALTEAVLFIVDIARSKIRFWRPDSPTYLDEEIEAARESIENLLSTLAEKERQGKRVLLVYSPIRAEIEGRPHEQLQSLLLETLSGSGMPFIDMRPIVEQEKLDEVYFDELHLEVHGHELYGREIARRIRELTNGQ